MTERTKPIAQTNNFIVLDKYTPHPGGAQGYQSEADLERELVQDLRHQGYEYLPDLTTPEAMLANLRVQVQALNDVRFTDSDWQRFVETWLDRPGANAAGKTRKIHRDPVHDFTFDNGNRQNIRLLDKGNIARNRVQVIRQFKQAGTHANRYDVTILVNGLPLVQIELKRRGMAIREAFNQIRRYGRESFNSATSLYAYLQLFVISNGTDTRYFANTTTRDKNSFDFTMNWAQANNSPIRDMKDFTATFLQKNTLLNILLTYSVLDASDTLLIMRPYQIAATERILWKIKSAFEAKTLNKPESGGYIWHTTGSGKTLTSFKAARLATDLQFIDRVFFVVDRKDLDYQTMKEYQRFSPDSVNGSVSTAALKRNLAQDDNRIIVTTIQKLNNLMKSESSLGVYSQRVVFIFDECHRSQFGEAQKNLKKKFKQFCQFGFTGTPIFPQNASGAETTASVFGRELHSYVITDAIRDEKVLKFKVDYNDVRPRFRNIESEQDEDKISAADHRQALRHLERIREVSRYILNNFRRKTPRMQGGTKGFNAMFAVDGVETAKLYYETLNALQADSDTPLTIATIFSFAANEEPRVAGDIPDEGFEISAMNSSAKEFLGKAIDDYNRFFKAGFSLDSDGFQNYYRDLAKRVKAGDVDLLIVVGMFLTGFDAPKLNTLFVDKNLRYHGLIQAFSRTNRIFDATKTFGNIITFRDLEQATIEAITLFGDTNTANVLLEKSYKDYMEGYADAATGAARRGFIEILGDLEQRFPDPVHITGETDKKDFVNLFGEYLRTENILRNYDEFTALEALQDIDLNDPEAVEAFRTAHHLSQKDTSYALCEAVEAFRTEHHLDAADFAALKAVNMPTDRMMQDYRSTYNDILEGLRRERTAVDAQATAMNWDGVTFEVDLLASCDIDLDYILELILKNNRKGTDKGNLVQEARRMIRASLGNRAKESLLVDFINVTDFDRIDDTPDVLEAFFAFARAAQQREADDLITRENLNPEAARHYMDASLQRGFASDHGTGLNAALPAMSPLNPEHRTRKQGVFRAMEDFVRKFTGIGGMLQ